MGVYIGSANLTHSARGRNIEAGCFVPEEEITTEIADNIKYMFDTLEENSTPLTEELIKVMVRLARNHKADSLNVKDFWNNPSFRQWSGLINTDEENSNIRRREYFLKEWYSTLQDLRNIGAIISQSSNRPNWINEDAPAGAQADQFLHAHYYERTFNGKKADYENHFERNKSRRDEALADAVQWWRGLPKAPSLEKMLNETAPFLRSALSEDNVESMDYNTFRQICDSVHAIKDYARRVANKAVGLPDNGSTYSINENITALSHSMWNDQSSNGSRMKDVLLHILSGSREDLPQRLWQAVTEPKWKINGLGISALGELVGWALPDLFPPRNGRTSKALRSLGYDVTIHV